jgi:hypothetical protein
MFVSSGAFSSSPGNSIVPAEKLLYTAKTHTTRGREKGAARSSDGLPVARGLGLDWAERHAGAMLLAEAMTEQGYKEVLAHLSGAELTPAEAALLAACPTTRLPSWRQPFMIRRKERGRSRGP